MVIRILGSDVVVIEPDALRDKAVAAAHAFAQANVLHRDGSRRPHVRPDPVFSTIDDHPPTLRADSAQIFKPTGE